MDDWSKVPSRRAVSEPAPNHQSPLTEEIAHDPLPDSACRVKRPTGDDCPYPAARALDPPGLARQHRTEVGAKPRPLQLPHDAHPNRTDIAAERQKRPGAP